MNKKILEILLRLFEYTGLDVCQTISLAIDQPQLFNINNKELLEALTRYEGELANLETMSNENNDEEDSY